jgi:hypothetical protein
VLMHCELQGFMAASKSWKGINPQEREKYEAMAQKLKVRIVCSFSEISILESLHVHKCIMTAIVKRGPNVNGGFGKP